MCVIKCKNNPLYVPGERQKRFEYCAGMCDLMLSKGGSLY
jgi:hypothetical protein